MGRVALVTGGSRGIGAAISTALKAEGYTVAANYAGNDEAASAFTAETGIKTYKWSVADYYACAAGIAQVEEDLGPIDILVNNAGINIAMGALTDLSPDAFDKMYQVNQRGPWYLASRLAPHMAENGGGVVINFLSVSALKPPAFMGFYAATKAALEALTKVMAQEWAPMNIRVNAIAPGSYHSDLTDGAIAAIPGFEEGIIDANLIKRIAASDEILNPVFYLAGESYTTGITLTADGGMMVK